MSECKNMHMYKNMEAYKSSVKTSKMLPPHRLQIHCETHIVDTHVNLLFFYGFGCDGLLHITEVWGKVLCSPPPNPRWSNDGLVASARVCELGLLHVLICKINQDSPFG